MIVSAISVKMYKTTYHLKEKRLIICFFVDIYVFLQRI